MKKTAAVFISIGVILVIVGLVMVGIFGRDKLKNFSLKDLINGTNHDLSLADASIDFSADEYGGLEKINVSTKRFSVYVLPSDDDTVSVKYVEQDDNDIKISAAYDNQSKTLNITEEDDLSSWWLFNLGLGGKRFIAVYLPQTEIFTQADISVKAETASVKAEKITADNLSVSARTGSVTLENLKAENALATSNTGSIYVEGVTCGKITARANTGSVKICDTDVSGILDVDVNTGSVKCEASAATFKIKTDTGSIDFKTDSADIDLNTDTGSVRGTVLGNESEYNIRVKRDTGKSNISDRHVENASKFLYVEVDTGSIKIFFENK